MGQWATLFVSMKSDEDEKNLKLKSIEKNLIITYASVNFHKCAIKVLKCYYDQILDIHFFTFSYTIGLS